MKKLIIILLLLFINLPYHPARATFYGKATAGFQYVPKLGSGYGVYVPRSFDPTKKNTLIFIFGRTLNDLALTKEQLKDYAELWVEESEKRGAVVVVPYWQPVVVEGHQHTEKFFLEVLTEAKSMYNISPKKVLLVGFGLGTVQAFSLAAFHPGEFSAVATIAGSPLRDTVTRNLMMERLIGGLPPGKLPPVLLVHGEMDTVIPMSWLQEDKTFLEAKGSKVQLKSIQGMAHNHDPRATSIILDWFETI